MKRSIRLGDRTVTYELTRKKVKNINIRVRADGSVGVSAGSWVPVTQIEAVLRARTHFLLDALDRFAAMESRRPVDSNYGPGSTVYLLGKAHPVVLFRGERNEVRQEGQTLQLFLKDPADTALRVKTMEAYLKEQCLSVTTAFCRQCQGKMAALGVPFPPDPGALHDLPLGDVQALRPAGYLCPAAGGGPAGLRGICGLP